MKQSTILFGALLAIFVVYITLRGQLPGYLALFTGGGNSSASNAGIKSEASLEKAFGNSSDIAAKLPASIKNKIGEVFSNMGLG